MRHRFLFRALFIAAAAYNIGFALWLWNSPDSLFGLISVPIPFPIILIKPLAIGIALFASIYGYAVLRPERARLWIFLCLLAKIIPPFLVAGFVIFLDWPVPIWKMMVCNDVIWWIPFFLFIKKNNVGRRP